MKDNYRYILLAIFVGGAIGTLFRYFLNMQVIGVSFPIGTVVENLLGSLLLGILIGIVAVKTINPILKEGLGVGFCGGFTTMSTLAADSVLLVQSGSEKAFIIYITSSLFGGVLLAGIGMALGSSLARGSVKAGEGE